MRMPCSGFAHKTALIGRKNPARVCMFWEWVLSGKGWFIEIKSKLRKRIICVMWCKNKLNHVEFSIEAKTRRVNLSIRKSDTVSYVPFVFAHIRHRNPHFYRTSITFWSKRFTPRKFTLHFVHKP